MTFNYQYNSIYYEKYGTKKKTIIILPGWGNTRKTFHYLIDYFQKNYSIYILDYPGFGNSKEQKEEWTIYNYAELIKLFLEEKKIENPIIIAHSFGGRIASILIGKYEIPVKKLILMDVAGIKRRKNFYLLLKQYFYKLLKKLSYLLPKKKQENFRKKLFQKFSSKDYKEISEFMRKTFQNIIQEDLKNYYKKIQTETLIIWGEKDNDTPLKDGYYLEKNINNSALIVYKNSTHFSYLDYPYETNRIIESFLKEKDK